MDREEIIRGIIRNGEAEVATLQLTYGITYKDAKSVVDELASKGELVYDGGVRYKYVGNRPNQSDKSFCELIDRLETIDKASTCEGRSDEDELRYRALKICIESKTVSFLSLMRELKVSYKRIIELIDWMESNCYISEPEPCAPRRILITREQFDRLYGRPHYVDVDISSGSGEDGESLLAKFRHVPLDEINTRIGLAALNSEKKAAPVSAAVMPPHPLWPDEKELAEELRGHIEILVKSDKNMELTDAVKKAEKNLEAVRSTRDEKTIQLFERLVYEMKNTSEQTYRQLKKTIFGN